MKPKPHLKPQDIINTVETLYRSYNKIYLEAIMTEETTTEIAWAEGCRDSLEYLIQQITINEL